MTSQVSIAKLLKLEMKQNAWMLALAALVQFLAGPVFYLLSAANALTNYNGTDSSFVYIRLARFFDNNYFLIQLFAILLSIALCIFSYRYLFSKRMLDLYHSVPITRTRLFITKYLQGFLVWFLPFLMGSLMVVLIAALRLSFLGGFRYIPLLLKGWIGSTLLLILCFFIFYHLFLVAAYLSGNILNMLTNMVIMGVSVACIYALILCFMEKCYYNFCQSPSIRLLDLFFGLSPLLTPFYMYSFVESDGLGMLLTEHPVLWIVCLLLTLASLLMSLHLCKKRPSELAERGTTHPLYKIPARILATFIISLAVAFFFGQLVVYEYRLVWGIFGSILGGILCFGIINSIYHTTIKSFFKSLPQMLGVTLLGVLCFLSFHYDWYGYDTYLPDKEDIAGVAISTTFGENTDSIQLNPNSAQGSVFWTYYPDNTVVYQENLLTDKDICYDFLHQVIHEPKEKDVHYLYAKIQLKNGRTYYRQYALNDSDYLTLAPFIESEDYKFTNYKISTGLLGYPDTAEISFLGSDSAISLRSSEIKPLMDAYFADFEAHYSFAELSSSFDCYRIEVEYKNHQGEHFYDYLAVPDNYEKTLAILETYELDYLSSPDSIEYLMPHVSSADVRLFGSVQNYFTATHTPVILDDSPRTSTVQYNYVGSETQTAFQIEDPELLEQLYPLMYFGAYHASFGTRDYIYLGDVYTTEHDYISAWVKPGTLPESIIKLIEENLESNSTE